MHSTPATTPRTAPARSRFSSARAVVTAVFFAFAIGLGLWAGAIPVLLRQSGMDAAGLGLALTLHSAAYIAAMAGGGQLARLVAPRRLMLAALLANVATFAALFSAGSAAMLTLALTAVGLSAGLLDLAMNTEGTAVERDLGRPVLLGMHGAASAAFALGALSGSLLATAAGARWCIVPVLLVSLPAAWAVRRLGPRAGAVVPPLAVPTRVALVGDQSVGRGVALVGIVLGLTIGAEMAAQMWSARFLARQAADLAAFAGAGAAFFAGFQALVRLFGDALRQRFGDPRIVTLSLLIAAGGFATVAASNAFAWSLVGFALVGLGTACVVPCCFALVARQAADRAAGALGVASLVAGAIRLPTPLCLGFVAAAYSDALAFAGVAGALLLAAAVAHRGIFARRGTAP
jgi:MFS family permease